MNRTARDVLPAVRRPAARPVFAPGVLAIGASTGGPQALVTLIAGIAGSLGDLPVCVTLHMPRDLMPVIASHVARRCRIPTHVVNEVCALEAGHVYFAPGDRHLVLGRGSGGVELGLAASASRDFCQPAVDVMFESAVRAYGPRTLAVVLSGMGKDGLAGARAIAAGGGTILVQDQPSSAVWGMPGSIAREGLAAAVLPPEAIAHEILRRLPTAAARR